jgi:ArsR family transcriptional regulator
MKCANSWLVEFASIMKGISQEKRLQILCMLSKVDSLCVCDIIERLWIKQNLVSHHLKILKDLWFVTTQQERKNIHYAINQEKFDEFKDTLKHVFTI